MATTMTVTNRELFPLEFKRKAREAELVAAFRVGHHAPPRWFVELIEADLAEICGDNCSEGHVGLLMDQGSEDERWVRVAPGSWIVTAETGEAYKVTNKQFKQEYEEAT